MKRRGAAGHSIAVRDGPLNRRLVVIDGKVVATVEPVVGGWSFLLLGDAGWLPTTVAWAKRSRAEGAALLAVRRLVQVLLARHDAATGRWLTEATPVDNIMP